MPEPTLLHDRHVLQYDGGTWFNQSTVFSVVAAVSYQHRYAGHGGTCLEFWHTLTREEREPIKASVTAILEQVK